MTDPLAALLAKYRALPGCVVRVTGTRVYVEAEVAAPRAAVHPWHEREQSARCADVNRYTFVR